MLIALPSQGSWQEGGVAWRQEAGCWGGEEEEEEGKGVEGRRKLALFRGLSPGPHTQVGKSSLHHAFSRMFLLSLSKHRSCV